MARLADVIDYEWRWGKAENPMQLQALLDDASAIVSARSTLDQSSDDFASAAKIVVCSMVHRAIGSPAPGVGVSAMSQSANGFTESLTFDGAAGALYLTKAEKILLRADVSRAGFLSPTGEAAGVYD